MIVLNALSAVAVAFQTAPASDPVVTGGTAGAVVAIALGAFRLLERYSERESTQEKHVIAKLDSLIAAIARLDSSNRESLSRLDSSNRDSMDRLTSGIREVMKRIDRKI
jgi:hypothetical protein